MRFIYPAQLEQYSDDEVVVSFRDVPWCHTSGEDVAEALTEAADALEEAIAGCINHGEPIPTPSTPLPGEHPVALPIDMAAKAAPRAGISRQRPDPGCPCQTPWRAR